MVPGRAWLAERAATMPSMRAWCGGDHPRGRKWSAANCEGGRGLLEGDSACVEVGRMGFLGGWGTFLAGEGQEMVDSRRWVEVRGGKYSVPGGPRGGKRGRHGPRTGSGWPRPANTAGAGSTEMRCPARVRSALSFSSEFRLFGFNVLSPPSIPAPQVPPSRSHQTQKKTPARNIPDQHSPEPQSSGYKPSVHPAPAP